MTHLSSCSVHNMPAYPAGPCDCGADRNRNPDNGEWARDEAADLIEDIRRYLESAYVPEAIGAMVEALIAAEKRGRIVGLREAYELVPWIKGTECADASDAIHARLTELEKATG